MLCKSNTKAYIPQPSLQEVCTEERVLPMSWQLWTVIIISFQLHLPFFKWQIADPELTITCACWPHVGSYLCKISRLREGVMVSSSSNHCIVTESSKSPSLQSHLPWLHSSPSHWSPQSRTFPPTLAHLPQCLCAQNSQPQQCFNWKETVFTLLGFPIMWCATFSRNNPT